MKRGLYKAKKFSFDGGSVRNGPILAPRHVYSRHWGRKLQRDVINKGQSAFFEVKSKSLIIIIIIFLIIFRE